MCVVVVVVVVHVTQHSLQLEVRHWGVPKASAGL